jgi:hypothetical protein
MANGPDYQYDGGHSECVCGEGRSVSDIGLSVKIASMTDCVAFGILVFVG